MFHTMTKEHVWVKHVITPVIVLENDNDEPIVVVDPDQQRISEEEAVYGCSACGGALVEVFGQECEPDGLV